jgi:type I restriction enzyme R subunit
MDVKFGEEMKKYGSSRTRASAMQHAIRLQLAIRLQEDPTFYKTLSEKLEAILQELKDRWDEQIAAMEALLHEMVNGEHAHRLEGIEPKVPGPFFGLLRQECEKAGVPPLDQSPAELKRVVDLTRELVEHIQQEIRTVDFWQDPNSRRQLENWLYTTVRQARLIPPKKAETLATQLMELAYNRRRLLVS